MARNLPWWIRILFRAATPATSEEEILGAARGDVRQLILRQTLRPVALGLIAGMACAAGASRVLESVLFGISPLDLVSFVCAPLVLLAIAISAGLTPTRRLLAIEPVEVLRRD